jgi:hypothetical protein
MTSFSSASDCFQGAIVRIIYYNGINVIIQIIETGKVNLAKYRSKWYSISKQQIHSNESLGEEGAVSHVFQFNHEL